jgi:hypothetical protein
LSGVSGGSAAGGARRASRRISRIGACSLLLALGCLAVPDGLTPALGQTPALRLAENYEVQRINSPTPAQGGQLGWLGIANGGDLDGDGKDDLLVPQYNGPGAIHLISGATGAVIRTLTLPDPSALGTTSGNFVYPAKLADLGSCAGGQVSQTCAQNPIGAADGVPEIVVGAYGVDLEAPDLGRAYVFDGATGAVLKRVQMPPADRASEAAQFPGGKGFGFGRGVVSPASPFPADAPTAVKIGDLDGGGVGDFLVGNPTFYELGPATNPSCDPGPCPGSGRVYAYRGEDIAGTDPNQVLETPFEIMRNPMSQSGEPHDRFGHAILPIGDVGRCTTDPGAGATCPEDDRTTTRDGRPDFVVAQHRAEFPPGFPDSGVVWLHDGRSGAVLNMYPHPEPQVGSQFGYTVGSMSTAIGDVGNTVAPDILVAAVGQGVQFTHQGRAYILNGNYLAAGSGITLGRLDDPTPHRGENFGAPFAGVGDVAGDPRNEVLIGNAGPWQTGDIDNQFLSDVHVFSPASETVVKTFADPDQRLNSGFGQGVAQLGDVNGDGFMDFAFTSGFFTDTVFREGRLYIFRSTTASTTTTTSVTSTTTTTGMSSTSPTTTPAPVEPRDGYALAADDGGVFSFGDAGFFGSTGALRLAKPIVDIEYTPSGRGYWLVASDGGVFAFGDARFLGSTGAMTLAQPVVGMAATPSGNGYWLVAADGGVFAFGDAVFRGSTGGMRLARPVVDIERSASGAGYWLVGSDGGIFAFGDAVFHGSTGATRLVQPIVGMSRTRSGGYHLVAADGGVFAFGGAVFHGSTGGIRLASPIVAMAEVSDGSGYWLCAGDGGVFAFGNARFRGSMGSRPLNRPVVGCSAAAA